MTQNKLKTKLAELEKELAKHPSLSTAGQISGLFKNLEKMYLGQPSQLKMGTPLGNQLPVFPDEAGIDAYIAELKAKRTPEVHLHVAESDVQHEGLPVLEWEDHAIFWGTVNCTLGRRKFDLKAYLDDSDDVGPKKEPQYIEVFGERGLRDGIRTRVDAHDGHLAENGMTGPDDAVNYTICVTLSKRALEKEGLRVSPLYGNLVTLEQYLEEAKHNYRPKPIESEARIVREIRPKDGESLRQTAEKIQASVVGYIQAQGPLDKVHIMIDELNEE